MQLLLESDAQAAKGGKPKTKAAIKAAQKKKRRAEGEDSDESDDFMPVKTKAKAVGKRSAPAKASPIKASPLKRGSAAVSDGSDIDVKPPRKASVKKKATNATTANDLSEDDSRSTEAYLAYPSVYYSRDYKAYKDEDLSQFDGDSWFRNG